jgi:glycosyltransferase 2 family protein
LRSIPQSTKPTLRVIRLASPYLIAAACLVWVFHDVRAGDLLINIYAIQWGWVALAIVFDVLSYLFQGARWQLLLRPTGAISLLRTTQAIYAGLFINEVLPMRVGEIVRAYLVSRWVHSDLVSVIPSMALERLLDGVWLAVGIGLTAFFVALPRDLREAGVLLGVIVLVATGVLVYVIMHERVTVGPSARGERLSWKWLSLVTSSIRRLVSGVQSIGRSRYFYMALGLSLLLLVLQGSAFWLIMWSYGLRSPYWVGLVVFLIVHLGTALPNAPANLGTYQFFCVVGLTLFGFEKTLATGFSLVVFVLLTIPLWGLGFVALKCSGSTLYTIRDEINRWTAQ